MTTARNQTWTFKLEQLEKQASNKLMLWRLARGVSGLAAEALYIWSSMRARSSPLLTIPPNARSPHRVRHVCMFGVRRASASCAGTHGSPTCPVGSATRWWSATTGIIKLCACNWTMTAQSKIIVIIELCLPYFFAIANTRTCINGIIQVWYHSNWIIPPIV